MILQHPPPTLPPLWEPLFIYTRESDRRIEKTGGGKRSLRKSHVIKRKTKREREWSPKKNLKLGKTKKKFHWVHPFGVEG
jgi:hypothetical protein